ncbi:hypothetical protein GLYMA_14G132200v4 [Glycine max]|uniref:Uncharacterized protein n=2 Tax=Glycine subgen. Soja TaxID=1462606 RepID=K7M6J1_SOYBN|nr:hypothetical protein GYH30_039839 [Glycine max]KRH16100.1 hypothetical protein GLYMA_14G132200v4 [Glycine max]RZB68778.1 NADH dehydrogenase [ubiquinone] 1 beta subcomplex subunit 7 [Glycine soja]
MKVEGSSEKMIVTQQEEMVEARPEFYLPWKCENECHSYEKCEYELVMEKMLQMQKIHQHQQKSNPKQLLIPLPKLANA